MNTNIIATLIDSKERVNVGDMVTDFRGDVATVTGFQAPRGASTGRVHTDKGSFYPSVFGIELNVESKNLPSMVDAEYGTSGCATYALVDSAIHGVNNALTALRVIDFDGVDVMLDELHEIHQALHVVYMTRFDD